MMGQQSLGLLNTHVVLNKSCNWNMHSPEENYFK